MNKIKNILFVLLLLTVSGVFAQNKPDSNKQLKARAAAKRVIKGTAVVIYKAHKAVKKNKVYTGNLAKAIAHQKFARKLYREGKYHRAIHHSRRARILARMALKANKEADNDNEKLSKDDQEFAKNPPSDAELEKELMQNMPSEPMKDEEVINSEPDVDLKDDE